MLCSQAFSTGNPELAGVYTRIATLFSLAAGALLAVSRRALALAATKNRHRKHIQLCWLGNLG